MKMLLINKLYGVGDDYDNAAFHSMTKPLVAYNMVVYP